MNKDLYEVLGLSRNATDKDIKSAYKKLALKWHPDRQGNKSDKEKKEAEEKFKEISFAYSILSDPEKKQRYDQFGITDDQAQMGGGFEGFDPSEIFKHFMSGFGGFDDFDNDPFGSFFGRRSARQAQAQKGQSIRMQIPVSIEELLSGVHRDVKYDIQIRCPKCGGAGGQGVETCPHCHGTGMITEVQRTAFGIVQNSHPCQYCHGSGQKIKNVCVACGGTGFVRKENKVRIDFGGGFENGKQILYNGKGYESKDPKQPNGDLLIELVYQFDKDKYAVNGYNIYEKIDVPYYDCILGKELEHKLPNGDKVKIKIPKYTQDQTIIDTKLRYGYLKYNVMVHVKMPTYIRDKEKELLEKLRNENGKN